MREREACFFSLCIGIATTLVFGFRALAVKIRFAISGGKSQKIFQEKIPFVIFSDHKRYWNVFKPVCDEFERRKIPLVFYTQSADDPALNEKYEFVKCDFIGEGNRGFVKLNFLNADVILSTTPGLDVLQWKRSKDARYYIHIQHSITNPSIYRMFALDNYDAVLLTGAYQEKEIRILENERKTGKKELPVTGSVYMDEAQKKLKSLEKYAGCNLNDITVLVAPSWGKNAILSKFGEKFIDALLKTNFRVIIRPHPQSKTAEKELLDSLMEKYRDESKIEWNFDNDNLSVMNRADILVSDFSGIIFDFALLLNRPVIYADVNFDSSEYDAAWIDYELWTFSTIKKIGVQLKEQDFCRMDEVIKSALKDESLQNARKIAREESWQFQGESAKRTVDFMIEKSEISAKEKSL